MKTMRAYLHFDPPVSSDSVAHYVRDPTSVATHPFYPFLAYVKKNPKYIRSTSTFERDQGRIIMYAAHLDSAIYTYYASILSADYESRLLERGIEGFPIAYRKLGKSNIGFAAEAFEEIIKRRDCVAICLDVKDFFGTMDHEKLKQRWCDVLQVQSLPVDHYKVFRSVTRYGYVWRDEVLTAFGIDSSYPRPVQICQPDQFRSIVRGSNMIHQNDSDVGIPQGSPISALLSNIYMFPFDDFMGRLSSRNGWFYRRYSDDILLIVPDYTDIESLMRFLIQHIASQHSLAIHSEKRDIVCFRSHPEGTRAVNGPLQYLGFLFDGRKVLIRSSTLARYQRRMRGYIRRATKTAITSPDRGRLYRKKAYRLFGMNGHRSFLRSYAYRADGQLDLSGIRRQVRNQWRDLNRLLDEAERMLALVDDGKTTKS